MQRSYDHGVTRATRCLAVAACILLPGAAAHAQANPARRLESPRLVAVDVVGNRHINADSILLASGLTRGAFVSPDALETARQRLVAMGCFSAAGDPERGVTLTTTPAESGVRVIIHVTENPVVRHVMLTGTGPLRAAEITPLVEVRPAMVLNLATYARDAEHMQTEYARRGYTASVDAPRITPGGVLTYPIHVGKLGPIEVVGVTHQEAARLERELRRRVGPYYRADLFAKALRQLGLKVDGAAATPRPDSIPIPRFGQPIRLRRSPMAPRSSTR